MLFATSGGGILIHEYLAKHGEHVSRVLLEATGGTDILVDNKIKNIGSNFTDVMKLENPQVLKNLKDILTSKKVNNVNLCFMLYKIQLFDINWKDTCSKLINEITQGNKKTYYKNLFNPEYNFVLTKFMLKSPMMESTKVRSFEILGKQINKYFKTRNDEINVPFECEKEMIADYLTQVNAGVLNIPKINLVEDIKKYNGEVLLLIGDVDNQFSTEADEVISKTYPKCKMALVHDTHTMMMNKKEYQNMRTTFFINGLYNNKLENIINSIKIK